MYVGVPAIQHEIIDFSKSVILEDSFILRVVTQIFPFSLFSGWNTPFLFRKLRKIHLAFEVLHGSRVLSRFQVISTNADINYAFRLFNISPCVFWVVQIGFVLQPLLMHLQIALKESEKITPYISIDSANCVFFPLFSFNIYSMLVYYIVRIRGKKVTHVGSGKLQGWSKYISLNASQN